MGRLRTRLERLEQTCRNTDAPGGAVLLAYDGAGLLAPVTLAHAPGEPAPPPPGRRSQQPGESEADYIAALQACGLSVVMWDFLKPAGADKG